MEAPISEPFVAVTAEKSEMQGVSHMVAALINISTRNKQPVVNFKISVVLEYV